MNISDGAEPEVSFSLPAPEEIDVSRGLAGLTANPAINAFAVLIVCFFQNRGKGWEGCSLHELKAHLRLYNIELDTDRFRVWLGVTDGVVTPEPYFVAMCLAASRQQT